MKSTSQKQSQAFISGLECVQSAKILSRGECISGGPVFWAKAERYSDILQSVLQHCAWMRVEFWGFWGSSFIKMQMTDVSLHIFVAAFAFSEVG